MKQLLLIILTSFLCLEAFAVPAGKVKSPRFSLDEAEVAKYDFEGIVKLNNCSGSLIIFKDQPSTHKAIVMTNGHCLGLSKFLEPNEILLNYQVNRSMKIYDNNFKLHSINAVKILYATMTKTDVAFYELSETYDEILQRTNVRPFLLDSTKAVAGENIEIISGYWDRGYSCQIDKVVKNLKEGKWSFSQSLRYTKECNTIGGTSGSPIIAKGSRIVIAINNTGNEDGKSCTLGNPCEVSDNGDITVLKGINYGQQTFEIYGCMNSDFKIDLKLESCLLPK